MLEPGSQSRGKFPKNSRSVRAATWFTHCRKAQARQFPFALHVVLPQSNINSGGRFGREVPARDLQEWPGRDPVKAEPFCGRLIRAILLMAVAIVAHLFVVRAPDSPNALQLASAPVATLPIRAAETNATPEAPDAMPPSVTVQRRELVAVPTTGLVRPQPPKPVISGTELLAIGTSGRTPSVDRNRAAVREPAAGSVVDTERTDVVPAGISEHQGAGAPRHEGAPRPQEEKEPSRPEAALTLPPMPASRTLLASVPRNVSPPVIERVIRTAPIVEPDPLVLSVLHKYADSYARLDAEATKAVYPTVNYAALRRAFNQLETQRLTFQSCKTTISGSGRDAYARCHGEASYRPRVGRRTLHRDSREWTFDLAKADDGWHIVKATVR